MIIRPYIFLLSKLHNRVLNSPIIQKSMLLNKTCSASIYTTQCKLDLREFFEDEKNWGKKEIKVGRAWKLDELRIKSNEDLHKIWYVLLKEYNMLLTMEHYHDETWTLFPNPERIDKVKLSMKNLETAVRERNKAYFLLETGTDGERPGSFDYTGIGMRVYRKKSEHIMPRYMNTTFKNNRKYLYGFDIKECDEFLMYYREKNTLERTRQKMKDSKYIIELMKRFKNLDLDHLQELYPDVDVKNLAKKPCTQGHWEPEK